MKPRDPMVLLKGVVSARHREVIAQPGYFDALAVMEKHFEVYEHRLRVLAAPASYPDGDVLLEAAGQGLESMKSAVEGLKKLDPLSSPRKAKAFLDEAEEGFELLMKLKEVTEEKRSEFEESYRELSEHQVEAEAES